LRLIPAFLFLLFSAMSTFGSSEGVRLRGTVVDEDGKPVADIEVRIRTPEQQVYILHTDAAGLFEFSDAAAGHYAVSLNKAGFFRVPEQPVLLKAGDNEITFTANHETEIHEEVEVYSSTESIKPLVTSRTDSLLAREIRDIPVPATHDLRSSLQVLPEVIRDRSGQLHVAGGRPSETQYLLDGFDIGDPVTGDLSVRVNVDSVRNAEVESGRYGSEYGRAGAGVLSMDTAVGDDRWRASANNFVPGLSTQRGLHVTSWYPRFTLSGPIRKERAWFSEALSVQRTLSLVEDLPREADSVTQWAGDNMLRTQVKLTPKSLLQGNFLYNQLKASNLGLSPTSPISTTRGMRAYRSFVSVKDQVWSGRTFYELGIAADLSHNEIMPHGFAPYKITPNGSAGNYFEALWQKTRRWQAVGSISMPTRHWHGTHDLQFGFNLSEFGWRQSAERNLIEVVRNDQTVLQRTEFSGPAQFSVSDVTLGMYADDVWHIFPTLVIQTGFRTDWDRILQRATPSPRIAVNFLPSQNDRAKITAAWGVFLQPVTLSLFGPAYDQQRSDTFFGLPPRPPVTGPILSRFVLPEERLKQPRFYTVSLGYEQTVGRNSQFELSFTRRKGRFGLAYDKIPADGPENNFLLQNNRRDRYHSLQFSFKHSFSARASMSVNYTRSSARSNHILDYSLETLVFSPQQPGPLDWDAPNRFVSTGWAPAPVWDLFLSYFLEYRSGFPFSLVNEQQQIIGAANQMRFPSYFSLNIGIEKRIHLFTREWAIRLTILNVTGHNHPDSVINNVDSPDFLKFLGGQRRSFTGRVRLVG
jgi:hypothetical protein